MNERETIGHVFKLLMRFKLLFTLSFLLVLAESYSGSLQNYYLTGLLDSLHSNPSAFYKLLQFYGACSLFQVIIKPIGSFVSTVASQRMCMSLRTDLFSSVLRRGCAWVQQHERGRLLLVIGEDVQTVVNIIGKKLFSLLSNMLYMLWGMYMITFVSIRLALIYFVVSLLYVFLIRYFTTLSKRLAYAGRTLFGQLSSFLAQKLSAVFLIKVLNTHHSELSKFNALLLKLYRNGNLKAVAKSCLQGVSSLVPLVGLAVCVLAAYQIGHIKISQIVTFIVYTKQISSNSQNFAKKLSKSFIAIADLRRILQVWDQNAWVEEKGLAIQSNRTCLNLQGVYYSVGSRHILQNITTRFQEGKCFGIVGESGSGKSTLAKIILRNLKPSRGLMRLNGIPVENYTLEDYHHCVTCVQQDPFLFSGSIRQNIQYGSLKSNQQQLDQAVRLSGLQKVVFGLPLGLNTILNQNGQNLSGGQKQKVAIARALIGKPRIILLDQATSAMDSVSQSEFNSALKQLRALDERLILIIVAHRRSSISNCDKILVLDKGQLVEQGQLQELMEKGGHFAKLFRSIISESS